MKINPNTLEVRELGAASLEQMSRLVAITRDNMLHPECLGDFTHFTLANLLQNGSQLFGWFDGVNLAALGMLFPANRQNMKKLKVWRRDYRDICLFGPEMVAPNYRGNGIQDKILDKLIAVASRRGFTTVYAAIHTDNFSALENVKNAGFYQIGIVKLKREPHMVLELDISK